jgi:AmiR/NasT family two-component response regulator
MIGVTAETQSELGLATRDIIGQAERILMHWMDLTSLQAFRLLTRLSQQSNTKLVEIARLVVEQHQSKVKPANP